jgi:TetR/AcrR family transcriptional regulator, tetracycline repressor protein
MGSNALRYSERVLTILRAGGVPPRLAVQGHQLLMSAVNGFTLDETGAWEPGGGQASDQAGRQDGADLARDYLASLPAERFPHLVELADEYTVAESGERFELLLDIFVDGLVRHAGQPAQSGLDAGPG